MTIVQHTKDDRFTIIASLVNEAVIGFCLYEINSIDVQKGERYYGSNFVTDYNLITPYVHGHIKWDGCSNWHFDAQDRCMLHFCSLADIQSVGNALTECWDIAKQQLANNWEGE